MSVQPIIQSLLRKMERESPTILTALGITGIPTAIFMAIRATPKALELLEDERATRYKEGIKRKPISKFDTIKITWKCYVPTVLVSITSMGCIIAGHSINLRRNAAIASLYSVTEAALKEYQEKVIEVIGKNKEEKIYESIMQDRLDKHPLVDKEVFVTGKGEILFFDSWSGRYFKSDMETVRKAQNDLNSELLGGEMYISLNSFYYDLGLEKVAAGDDIGWDLDDQLEIKFRTKIAKDSIPCIVLDYSVYPKEL